MKYFPSVKFKIGRFGKDEADLNFQDVIEGNVIQMADRVMETLQSKYLVSPEKSEGMQSDEKPEIPTEAIREIVYNAITNKDYTGPEIQMRVYDDSIEIWNEGELPEEYDEKVLYSKHSSKPRNQIIADTMNKAGFILTWGCGFKKIRDGFEMAGLPMPKVQNICGGVLVTIELTKEKQASGSVNDGGNFGGDVAVLQLSERQKSVCEIVKSNPKVTVDQMAVTLSVAKRTLEREIAALQKMGVLVREGNTNAGHWVVIKDFTDSEKSLQDDHIQSIVFLEKR